MALDLRVPVALPRSAKGMPAQLPGPDSRAFTCAATTRSFPGGASSQAPDRGGLRSRPGVEGLTLQLPAPEAEERAAETGRERLVPTTQRNRSLLSSLSENFDLSVERQRAAVLSFLADLFKIFLSCYASEKVQRPDESLQPDYDKKSGGGRARRLPPLPRDDLAPGFPGSKELGETRAKGSKPRG